MTERRRSEGFTLVELVLVIAISAVIGAMIASVLSRPLDNFVGQSRRAELVDRGAAALSRMQRDIRLAVPNSLRVSGDGQALELLEIYSAGRYRPNRLGGEILNLSPASDSSSCTEKQQCKRFCLFGSDFPVPQSWRGWLVVYNVGAESGGEPTKGSNVWADPKTDSAVPYGVITPLATFKTSSTGYCRSSSDPGTEVEYVGDDFRFQYASPQKRAYFADRVVGYRCVGGELLRYEYAELQPSLPESIPAAASRAAQAGDVAGCTFAYRRGTGTRAGLATLRLRLSVDGESVELIQQVHVDNAP